MSKNHSRCYNICLEVQAIRFSKPLIYLCHYEFQNEIANIPKSFRVILCVFSKFIRLLCFISHISKFHYELQNKIATLPKSFRAILCMFSKFIRLLYFTSHTSKFQYEFQNFSMSFKIFYPF